MDEVETVLTKVMLLMDEDVLVVVGGERGSR